MRPSFAYPPALKTILKAGPVLMVFTGFGLCLTTLLYTVVHHPHEHVEKYFFRSGKFMRTVRSRDNKLRYYYAEALDWQPNEVDSLSPNRGVVRN